MSTYRPCWACNNPDTCIETGRKYMGNVRVVWVCDKICLDHLIYWEKTRQYTYPIRGVVGSKIAFEYYHK